MTERTFREPSPNRPPDRPASSHGPYPRYDNEEAPPVPALPKNIPQISGGRPTSVEPPQRISSPPPRQPVGRGVSLDRGPGVLTPPPRTAKAKKAFDSVGELERVGSRASVNFSRPMSPQNSPPVSPIAGVRVRSPPPTNATPAPGLANGEAERITNSIQESAERPVKKKKKKVVLKGSAEGSHLAAGTSGGPPHGTAMDATPQRKAPPVISEGPSPATSSRPGDIDEAPLPKKKKKKKIVSVGDVQKQAAGDAFGGAYPSDSDSVTSERSSTTDRPRSYNTRAAGLLAKQPSIVREDREAEEQAEQKSQANKANRSASTNGAAAASTPANTSKIVSKDRQHSRSVSQQTPTSAPKLDVPSAGRPLSLSPVRAAHFSAQPINEGAKHQPPARSVSPAKSALKNSPSRGHSPVVTRGLAPSEASDTASQISDDGSRSSATKKKKTRVSFDDGSVVVGRAASPPTIPDSPVLMSPQTKSAKNRTWIDLVREKKQDNTDSDRDEDGSIKPTPKLPSFGSVRAREQKPRGEVPGEATPSEDWAKGNLQSMDTSTDLAVGQVIFQDAATKQNKGEPQLSAQRPAKDPLPPQVTSVEGSGYHSDEGELFRNDEKKAIPPLAEAISTQPEGVPSKAIENLESTPNESLLSNPSAPHVPSIAVEPATPGMEEALANRDSWLGMPGGFPSLKGSESGSTSKLHTEHQSPVITPATVGIAEPEPEGEAAQHDPDLPAVGQVAQGLRTQIDVHSGDESEDTAGDSVYSDAAEDQSDMEGDGFGSINAIVESPTSPKMAINGKSPPASPGYKVPKDKLARPELAPRMDSEVSEPPLNEGWDRAQAYWSGLSQTRKQQLEQAALPGAIDEPVVRNRSMRGVDAVQKKKKKKKVKQTPQPLGSSDALNPASTQPLVLKSSMRAASPTQDNSAPHMRSSMRAVPTKPASKNSDKRNSLTPASEPKVVLQKKTRPVSAVAMVDYNRTEPKALLNRARTVSAGSPAISQTPLAAPKKKSAAVQSKLQRANSDSDSSFKKARAKTPDNGRYTMKRSMRGQSSDATPNRASSMAARTSFPADSMARRPFSSVGPSGAGTMRTSMRGSMDSGKPAARTSLRDSMDSSKAKRTKSPPRFSFMGSSKSKPVESKPTTRFSSRFGDSSDEDGLPTMASSRFADSSDEEEPAALAPVRGIPRRINEGDSTDLEDSSVENAPAPTKAKENGNVPPALVSPEGAALATGSLRTPSGGQPPTAAMGTGLQAKKAAEKEKKKRSFFGSLGSRKRDDSSRVQKSDIESPARRDTPLERTKVERMSIAPATPKATSRVLGPGSPMADPVAAPRLDTSVGQGSQTNTVQNSPKSPKLQRRNTPKRITSTNDISWPLPQTPADTVSTPTGSRPRTSDGAPVISNGVARPSLALRGQSEINGVGGSVAVGKKKRFPMLRKAFGLHD